MPSARCHSGWKLLRHTATAMFCLALAMTPGRSLTADAVSADEASADEASADEASENEASGDEADLPAFVALPAGAEVQSASAADHGEAEFNIGGDGIHSIRAATGMSSSACQP